MSMKDKLIIHKRIEAEDRKHLEEYMERYNKTWTVNYAFVDRHGVKRTDDMDYFPSESNQIEVKALNIQDALDKAKTELEIMGENRGWREIKIWDIGICNANIW